MSFCIDDEKLLEKYKAIWNKIKDFKKIKVKPLIMDSNFKIMYAMNVMMLFWYKRCYYHHC